MQKKYLSVKLSKADHLSQRITLDNCFFLKKIKLITLLGEELEIKEVRDNARSVNQEDRINNTRDCI